jgi:hypothetical protein
MFLSGNQLLSDNQLLIGYCFLANNQFLAEIKLGRALSKAGLVVEARRQWRDIVRAGHVWNHPRLWWKVLKLAVRAR